MKQIMAGRLVNLVRRGLRNVPGFDAWQRHKWLQHEFQLERELLRGIHHNTVPHPSIIHFSVHKSATQYVKSILSRCASENGMQHVRMNEFAFFKTNMPYLHTLSRAEMKNYRHIFRPYGYLYSIFAGMVDGIPDFAKYRSVLVIRDPRDALTSEFFSILHNHPPPEAREKRRIFLQRRAKARRDGIDRYVLSESERVRREYLRYLELLVPSPSALLLKYEDMIADFESWLDQLLEFCELKISGGLRDELLHEARASRAKTEDVTRHARQITPGDHRRKLAPATIRELNDRLAEALGGFKYV